MINIRNIPLTGTYEDIVRLRDAYTELATDLSMTLAALGLGDTSDTTTEKLTELTAVTATRLTANKIIVDDIEAETAAATELTAGTLTADAANLTDVNTENIVMGEDTEISFDTDSDGNEELYIKGHSVYIEGTRIYLNTSNLYIDGVRYSG